MSFLYLLILLYRHVVPKIIKSELTVGAIGDILAIGCKTVFLIHKGRNDSHRESHTPVNRAHPFGVACRKIVVYGYNVDSAPRYSIQGYCESRNKGFSLSRLHFGYFALVKCHSSHELLFKMSKSERSYRNFPYSCKNLRKHIVKRFSIFKTCFKK